MNETAVAEDREMKLVCRNPKQHQIARLSFGMRDCPEIAIRMVSKSIRIAVAQSIVAGNFSRRDSENSARESDAIEAEFGAASLRPEWATHQRASALHKPVHAQAPG